jgi:hypothetical protein
MKQRFAATLIIILLCNVLLLPPAAAISTREGVTLLQPVGGEILAPGQTYEIRWTATATGGQIALYYTLIGENLWNPIAEIANPSLEPGEPSSFSWTVPSVETEKGRIQIVWMPVWGNSFVAQSPALFSIRKTIPTFPDVPTVYWAGAAIQRLSQESVIRGYPDGTFRPEAGVTRAEFAKMLMRSLGFSPVSPEPSAFTDVLKDHWAYGDIHAAAAHGYMVGYPDGTFQPNGKVTKAEVVTVIVRAKAWNFFVPDLATFSDCLPTDWFTAYVETAVGQDLIPLQEMALVRQDGTGKWFDPNQAASRAQTAFLLAPLLVR